MKEEALKTDIICSQKPRKIKLSLRQKNEGEEQIQKSEGGSERTKYEVSMMKIAETHGSLEDCSRGRR